MNCEVCGKLPTSDEVIFSRGYLWHRPCCRLIIVGDDELVDFPSEWKAHSRDNYHTNGIEEVKEEDADGISKDENERDDSLHHLKKRHGGHEGGNSP